MHDLPHSLFADPPRRALASDQRELGQSLGQACRYLGDVAPFASIAEPTVSALADLHALLADGESTWIFADTLPAGSALTVEQQLRCLQMLAPAEIPATLPAPDILELSASDAPSMVALTDVAFPGFFRPQTPRMGTYFGIFREGTLVAMVGERFVFDGYSEISGLCTHPDHRGAGHAAALLWHLVRWHRARGVVSWLHVASGNTSAIALYRRLGFVTVREITIQRVTRPLDA